MREPLCNFNSHGNAGNARERRCKLRREECNNIVQINKVTEKTDKNEIEVEAEHVEKEDVTEATLVINI